MIELLVLRVVRGVVGQTSLVGQSISMHELEHIRGVTYQYACAGEIEREREMEGEIEREREGERGRECGY